MAEAGSIAEHADVLQYLLTGAVIIIGALIKRDVGRIEKRGDLAMSTLFGTSENPGQGLVTRVAVIEERCEITHGEKSGSRH